MFTQKKPKFMLNIKKIKLLIFFSSFFIINTSYACEIWIEDFSREYCEKSKNLNDVFLFRSLEKDFINNKKIIFNSYEKIDKKNKNKIILNIKEKCPRSSYLLRIFNKIDML